MSPIRVVVADDHEIVRQGLRLFLDLHDDIVVAGEAGDGAAAVEVSRRERPDVVLMDLSMPELDGIEATRAITGASPETKVLVLTSFADDDTVVAAVRAGAAGYLMKEASPEEVAEAIRTIHRGDPLLHPDAARGLMRQLADPTRVPEGTVTIIFTDVEASTELFQRLGDEKAREVLREHDRVLSSAVHEHGGTVVKHQGDGFMVAFASARRAIACAVEIQRAFSDGGLGVRVGVNTGEVVAEDDDYFGSAVILAARIARAARGGEILVSEATKGVLPRDGMRLLDRGEHQLRGMSDPLRLYEAVWTA